MTSAAVNPTEDVVLFDELACASNHKIGIATLNSPKTLNGLSLEMCQLLDARLRLWADDAAIAAVIITGAGDKAFCAGGDLHGLYRGMQESDASDAWSNTQAREFFTTEYQLDYLIHTYKKPVIVWASGFVMGGGVGLMMGASRRLVTETTQMAMPEITIGLYPDVAGTWMLGRLPKGIGEFLALTGAKLNAADCVHFGLADRYLKSNSYGDLLKSLSSTKWADDTAQHGNQLDQAIDGLAIGPGSIEPGPLQNNSAAIMHACNRSDFNQICVAIENMANSDEQFLARAAKTFKAGSPGSARLGYTLLNLARHSSLADTFRREFVASLHCCAEPDFREGIRALLIDKDKNPQWQPATLAQADENWVQRFFVEPWPAGITNPLAGLK